MNNFLQLFTKKPQQQEVERQKMREEALAVARNPPTEVGPASLPKDEDLLAQVCVCAKHDREYYLFYQERPNGTFMPIRAAKIESSGGGGPSAPKRVRKIPRAKIVGSNPECPWCGTGGSHYHCRCGGIVCGGKELNGLFRCRKSCGAKWRGVECFDDIEASVPSPSRNDFKAPAVPMRSKAPAQSDNNPMLRIGPGSTPATRRAD